MWRGMVVLGLAVVVVVWTVIDLRKERRRRADESARVAIVLSVGGLGDRSFNDGAYRGLQTAVRDLGIHGIHGEPADMAEDYEYLRIYAESGFDLIIGVGFLMQDAITRVADEFPECRFAIIDAVVDRPNVASLVFCEEEGSFLVGALAAMKSTSGTIGFVGGMDIPLIHRFLDGYRAGARAVRPDVTVLSAFCGTDPGAFRDPVRGKEKALAQFSRGADVVFQAAGFSGNGVIAAAAEQGRFAIGVDSNQNDMRPGFVLTSMLKRVDVAVHRTIEDVVAGRFEGGVHRFGLAEDGVGYAVDEHNRHLLTPEMIETVEGLRRLIVAGEIEVTGGEGADR
jgi:basic membrane protein A and related proteins